MSATLTYVFCLVRSARRPSVRGIADAMPGGTDLRAIEAADELWAIVQSVPEREFSESALAAGLQNLDWVGPRAIAHERVIESFLKSAAVLPMQLFTLFTSDDRVVEHVRSDRARIQRILRRIANKVEWGLRLTWDEKAVREKAAGRQVRSGAEFLARKRDLLDVNRTQLVEAKSLAERVYKSVARTAAAAHRRTSLERAAPGSRLLLDAAFLVPVDKSGVFKSSIREQSRQLRGAGISLSLTGPWPAYNFIQ